MRVRLALFWGTVAIVAVLGVAFWFIAFAPAAVAPEAVTTAPVPSPTTTFTSQVEDYLILVEKPQEQAVVQPTATFVTTALPPPTLTPEPPPQPPPPPAAVVVAAAAPAPAGDLGSLISQYDWPVDEALAIARCESGMNPGAYNPSGASGLFQVMPLWFTNAGLDASLWADPATNIAAAYGVYVYSGRSWSQWDCKPYTSGEPQVSYEDYTATGIRLPGGRGTWFYNPAGAPAWAGDASFAPAAIAEWNSISPNLVLSYSGTTTVATSLCNGQVADGQNSITWGPDMGSTIAITCWQTTATGGECDVLIGQNLSYVGIDFTTVLAHELGHCIGLGHTPDYAALMNAFYHGITGPKADDIAGVCAIYGCGNAPTPTPSPARTSPPSPPATATPTGRPWPSPIPNTPTPTPTVYRVHIPGLAVD